MILICAWCKKNLGEKRPLHNKGITHVICKFCADKLKITYSMSDVLTMDDVAAIKSYTKV